MNGLSEDLKLTVEAVVKEEVDKQVGEAVAKATEELKAEITSLKSQLEAAKE